MKTIGKIAALAMTLSLAFVLTACGGGASSSSAASSDSASSASASASSASASASSASASASSASAAAVDVIDDGATSYTNEFFGIDFNLPAGWSFVDLTSLNKANEVVASAAGTAELDMAAMNSNQSRLIAVAVEAPNSTNAKMSDKDYLAAQEEALKASFGEDYAYETNTATVSFEGIDRELPASVTNVDLGGGKLYICQAVAQKDGYFFDIIVMGANEKEITSAFENFTSVVE